MRNHDDGDLKNLRMPKNHRPSAIQIFFQNENPLCTILATVSFSVSWGSPSHG